MSTPSTCCRCLQEPKLSPQLPSSGRMAPRHLEALYDHLDSEDTTRQARRPPANSAAPAVNGSARGSTQPPRVEISPPKDSLPDTHKPEQMYYHKNTFPYTRGGLKIELSVPLGT